METPPPATVAPEPESTERAEPETTEQAVERVREQTLQHVETIRTRILRGQQGELVRLRSYVSILGGNQDAVDRLKGREGDLLLARVVDMILRELGHCEALPVEHDGNKTRRAATQSAG